MPAVLGAPMATPAFEAPGGTPHQAMGDSGALDARQPAAPTDGPLLAKRLTALRIRRPSQPDADSGATDLSDDCERPPLA